MIEIFDEIIDEIFLYFGFQVLADLRGESGAVGLQAALHEGPRQRHGARETLSSLVEPSQTAADGVAPSSEAVVT